MALRQTFLEKEKKVSDEAVDVLEQMVRRKFELKTGYAETPQLARTFYLALRSMDVSDDESMDMPKFRLLMKKLNCGEDGATVDALFRRYDLTDSGVIGMKDFANELFGLKKVAKSNADCRDIIQRVRDTLVARGEGSYRGLVRVLRRMDGNGNRKLEAKELEDGLMTYGIHMTKAEKNTLFHYFDQDGDGHISITEFMAGLRPNMSPARLALVKQAFLLLDKNPDGQVTLHELASLYRTDKHPAVLEGTKTPKQVLAEFNDSWDKNGDDIVTEAEFISYYKDLSATIDNDQYFELMIRNAWHIAGGKGAAANTANLRVLVVHTDGSQTVECILNDLGLPDKKPETLKAALIKQGVTDILRVETAM